MTSPGSKVGIVFLEAIAIFMLIVVRFQSTHVPGHSGLFLWIVC
jgi:hypothetical protein